MKAGLCGLAGLGSISGVGGILGNHFAKKGGGDVNRAPARSPLNLNGTVHTANGIPIANADCTLQNLGKTTRTDANGRFNFTGQPEEKLKNGGEVLECTHPDYHGGLGNINTRQIPDYTAGHADARMFSKDPHWGQICGDPAKIHFNYTQAPDLEATYKQILGGDPSHIHGQIASETCQTLFQDPSHALPLERLDVNFPQLPNKTAANAHLGRIKAGNEMNLNSDFVRELDPNDPVSRKNLLAVQTHEAVHHQQSLDTNYIKMHPGYGEAMADTVMALNGFGHYHDIDLSTGAKCKGNSTAPYGEGAQYLAYIAKNHPTFVPEMMKDGQTDNFQDRVKRITKKDFETWVDDCRTKGMP